MKALSFDMLIFVIKLATIFLFINSALSATLSDGQANSTNEGSTTISAIDEDYDSGNASVEKSATADTKPPLVFPSDDKTETSKNETALEILQKNSNASAMTKSDDVTESPSTTDTHDNDDTASKETNSTINKEEESTSKQPQESDYDNLDEEDEGEKNDVENVQEENKDQGNLEETFGFNSTSIIPNPFEEPTLKSGHIALIFASTLIILSVVAYIGLVLWRNRLESRYGMRQRLVTEDDYYNNNDVRFFGL